MHRKVLIIVGVALASGCASGRQLNSTSDDVGSDAGVEFVVHNERLSNVTVFVQWEFGRSIRLGDLSGGRTRTFTTPWRGQNFTVTYGAVGARRGSFGGAWISAVAGDRFQWTLPLSGPVVYRRLPPN